MAGDGGFAMLLGDLMTVVQENLPIKIVVYDNGKLGFIDIEQKSAGLIPVYTDLKNPDFGEVAKAMGLWGRQVSKAGELEECVADLARAARPGAAGCEGESDAVGDAALALRFAGGRGRDGGLHRQSDAARQGPRRLGNDRGEHPLTGCDVFQMSQSAAGDIEGVEPHGWWRRGPKRRATPSARHSSSSHSPSRLST